MNRRQWHNAFETIYKGTKEQQVEFRKLCKHNNGFKEIRRWYWFNSFIPTKEMKLLLKSVKC